MPSTRSRAGAVPRGWSPPARAGRREATETLCPGGGHRMRRRWCGAGGAASAASATSAAAVAATASATVPTTAEPGVAVAGGVVPPAGPVSCAGAGTGCAPARTTRSTLVPVLVGPHETHAEHHQEQDTDDRDDHSCCAHGTSPVRKAEIGRGPYTRRRRAPRSLALLMVGTAGWEWSREVTGLVQTSPRVMGSGALGSARVRGTRPGPGVRSRPAPGPVTCGRGRAPRSRPRGSRRG